MAVTGAAGFLGRYVVHRLATAGYSVVGFGRSAVPNGAVTSTYRHQQIDLSRPASVDAVAAACGPRLRALVHLAAVFPASLDSPDAAACGRQNLAIDDHVLTVGERLRCPIVFASSASAYGTSSPDTRTEDEGGGDDRPYAREKRLAERAGLERLAACGARFAALRITAPYGPGQTTRTVVRIFLERALTGEPLRYHGTGTREQDFVHAADVADAVYLAVRTSAHGIFNIGSGVPITMRELAHLIVRQVPGCRSAVEPSGLADPQEAHYATFSIAKAGDYLGWMPRVALTEGVADWARAMQREASRADRVPV